MNLKRGAGVTAGFVGVAAGLVTLLEWMGVEFADLRAAVVATPSLIFAIVLLAGAVVVAVAFTLLRSSRTRTGQLTAITSPELQTAPDQPPSALQTRQGCVSIQVTISLGLVLLAGAALLQNRGISNQSSAPPMSGSDGPLRTPTAVVIAGTVAPIGLPAGTPWGRWANADGTLVPENELPIMVDAGCASVDSRDLDGVSPTCEAGPTT